MSPYKVAFCLLASAGAVSRHSRHQSLSIEPDAKQHLIRAEPNAAPDDSKSAAKQFVDADTKGPVSINLYYETRCPDCIEFINGTLAPLWRTKSLQGLLNVTMNPYGNAMSVPTVNVSEGYKFFHPETTGAGWDYVHICQHGTDECFGNLVQACAIKNTEQSKYMELILCMAAKPDWGIEKASYECMTSAGIDPKPIKECASSPVGNKLMAEFGLETGKVQGRTGTPWVMVDGINLPNVADLLKTACGKLGNGPEDCAPFGKTQSQDAPSPAAPAADDTFTVLPEIKKNMKKELVQISFNKPTEV